MEAPMNRCLCAVTVSALFGLGALKPTNVQASPTLAALANHTYEAKIRLDGKVSTTQVQASDAGHAKKLVQAQYGSKVTVLSVKRVD
jgi:hypothetical protein